MLYIFVQFSFGLWFKIERKIPRLYLKAKFILYLMNRHMYTNSLVGSCLSNG